MTHDVVEELTWFSSHRWERTHILRPDWLNEGLSTQYTACGYEVRHSLQPAKVGQRRCGRCVATLLISEGDRWPR